MFSSLRSSLALLVMACVIPASLMAVALIVYDYQSGRTQVVRNSLATARAMVKAVDRELTNVAVAADILSTSPPLKSGDLPAFYAQARSALLQQVGGRIFLSDATGQQLLNTLN